MRIANIGRRMFIFLSMPESKILITGFVDEGYKKLDEEKR